MTDNLTGSPRLDAGAGICDIRWEELANVQQWERKPRGTRLYPYAATRTNNVGSEFHNLRTADALTQL